MSRIALASLLAGCASYAPDASLTGKDRAAVIAAMGTPARERPHQGGTRLEYPRGQNTYFIDLDRSGRVARFENVLQPALYDRIRPGMSAADVEQIIGPASLKWAVARGDTGSSSIPRARAIERAIWATSKVCVSRVR